MAPMQRRRRNLGAHLSDDTRMTGMVHSKLDTKIYYFDAGCGRCAPVVFTVHPHVWLSFDLACHTGYKLKQPIIRTMLCLCTYPGVAYRSVVPAHSSSVWDYLWVLL